MIQVGHGQRNGLEFTAPDASGTAFLAPHSGDWNRRLEQAKRGYSGASLSYPEMPFLAKDYRGNTAHQAEFSER
jgi:hypothetical protein